jgi:hypothetical protein
MNARRAGSLVVAVVAAVACSAAVAPAQEGVVDAASVCTTSVTPMTVTLTCPYSDGAALRWTPPAGVTQADFDVVGAMGGGFGDAGPSAGGRVLATIPVDAQTPLTFIVGARGAEGGANPNPTYGEATLPADGGGATFVLDDAGTDQIVAGGGGGAGTSSDAKQAPGGAGGAGPLITEGVEGARLYAAAGADGGNGGKSGGGGGGTAVSGGFGTGQQPGIEGGPHQGGRGAMGGGGGGGGYYGGAGGGLADGPVQEGTTTVVAASGGAGGGGGSSYVLPGALVTPTFTTSTSETGDGSITLTFASASGEAGTTSVASTFAPTTAPTIPPPFGSTSAADDPVLPGAPPPEPQIDKTVVVEAVFGLVSIRRPGGQLVPLGPGEEIPLGSVIDARDGVVRLTAQTNPDGTVQTALFWGGIFRVGQISDGRGGRITRVTLTQHATGCGRGGARAVAAATRGKKKPHGLWGDGKGSFQTRGDHSAATVRGTKWYVENRCAGTYTRVVRGIVAVRDYARHRTISVTAGESYTATGRSRR